MALSETSLKEIDISIDIMELHKKFDDDWYNMYKSLTLENTLLSGETFTKDIRETLDELAAKTSKNEKRINALNKEMKENKDETDSVISDVSSRIHSLEQVQKETVFFRGIPYSCSEDFITRADFTDSSVFSVDASTGIKDGDTIAETMTKINDSICWIDLDDDPSVFTTNEGDRLLYNNE